MIFCLINPSTIYCTKDSLKSWQMEELTQKILSKLNVTSLEELAEALPTAITTGKKHLVMKNYYNKID